MISIVLLLQSPKETTETELRDTISRAVGRPLRGNPRAGNFLVKYKPMMYPIGIDGMGFGLINSPDPYITQMPADLDRQDARVRLALVNHRAWLSIDMSDATAQTAKAKAYPLLGKMIASLIDDNCLAVYLTESGRTMWPYHGIVDRLAGGDPLAALVKPDVTVIQVKEGDPEMKAAVAEARRRWPEFVRAFTNRRKGQGFSVKAPVTDGLVKEFIWISPDAIGPDRIIGRLANDPRKMPNLKLGDRVEVSVAEVGDWIYEDGKAQQGGFSIALLQRRAGR